MKKRAILILLLFLGIIVSAAAQQRPRPRPKVSQIASNISASEAHAMLKADPKRTFLIDVRSMAEYEFVGYPSRAYNIPYKFWSPKGMEKNPNFVQDVAEKFKKTDKLLIICRSGGRSLAAQRALMNAGYKHTFNVLAGFEGDKVRDREKPEYGHRRKINGWQHDGLPYTYRLTGKLVYKLHASCGCD